MKFIHKKYIHAEKVIIKLKKIMQYTYFLEPSVKIIYAKQISHYSD